MNQRIKHRYLTPVYGPDPYPKIRIGDLYSITLLHLEDSLPLRFRSSREFDAIVATTRDLHIWLAGEDFTPSTRDRITKLAAKRKTLNADELAWLEEAEQAESDMLLAQTMAAMGIG